MRRPRPMSDLPGWGSTSFWTLDPSFLPDSSCTDFQLTDAFCLNSEFKCLLAQKVNELQQQVATLTDNQINTDQRYNKVKQENAALQNNFKNGKSPSHSTQISFVPRRRLASSNDSLRTKNSCVLLRNANLPFKFETSGHQSKNLHVFDICMLVQKLLSPDS
ncbi:hypothetical protein TNCT_166101 [Trichonephila clavata]|uniref:Uncharacterized protein n=1 Tax=Trichonephila clavata TaxID=2740835 RepID=A0A8X6F1C1_TRICU|nr:hypothetical protein TNCT_166101 [Trichonephila clavata]